MSLVDAGQIAQPGCPQPQPQAPPLAGRPALARGLQRACDLALAGGVFLALVPLMLVISLCILVADGRPCLFRQARIGRGGQVFQCLKFRTMAPDSERRLRDILASDPSARTAWARDHKLIRDPRVTPLGRVLRKLSLDELPQLINVLRGDMALIGPRPIVAEEIPRYGRYFAYYIAVKPGLTGLWQVSGRSRTTYRRRVAADCYYVRRRSLRLKLWILFQTIPAVLLAEGSA
ncbi:sugar transferase [Phenylobacterium sp.]|uniref:sugar transferase n=1 Tax=Phenylobacterium sp. TaxID=1871053 RepID=UPI0035B45B0E